MCHQHSVPLIVDEAHGAHLGLAPGLPASALQQGADVAVQSTHKQLSALTQAAMLHVQGGLLPHTKLARALQVRQCPAQGSHCRSWASLCFLQAPSCVQFGTWENGVLIAVFRLADSVSRMQRLLSHCASGAQLLLRLPLDCLPACAVRPIAPSMHCRYCKHRALATC